MKIFITYPPTCPTVHNPIANWVDHGTYATYIVGNVAATSGLLSVANPLILSVTNSAALVETTPTSLGSFGIIYKQNSTNGLTQTRIKSSTFNTANYAFKAFANSLAAAVADTAINAQAGDSITIKWIVKNNSNGSDAYTIKFVSASEGAWSAGYYSRIKSPDGRNLHQRNRPAIQQCNISDGSVCHEPDDCAEHRYDDLHPYTGPVRIEWTRRSSYDHDLIGA